MATVTQNIPTLTGGISQQPDELKLAGQVNVAKNVLPDVTHGLLKRPGSELVKTLSNGTKTVYTSASKWFHYYRSDSEQYIGQIKLSTGDIRIWNCQTGAECDVTFASDDVKSYLIADQDEKLQTLTVNDYTFVTNRNQTVAMLSDNNDATVGKSPTRPPEAFIELKQIKYANQYALNLFDSDEDVEVTTATRIRVDRQIDSRNSCNANGVVFRKDQAGVVDAHSYECGHVDNKSTKSNNLVMRDALCPNTATKIFSNIGSDVAYFDQHEPRSHDPSVDQLDTWNTFGYKSGRKIEVGNKFFNFSLVSQDLTFSQSDIDSNNEYEIEVDQTTPALSVGDSFLFKQRRKEALTANAVYTVVSVANSKFKFKTKKNALSYTDDNGNAQNDTGKKCDIFHGDIRAYLATSDQNSSSSTFTSPFDYYPPITANLDEEETGNVNYWDDLGTKADYNEGIREVHTIAVFPESYNGSTRPVFTKFVNNLTRENHSVADRKNLSFKLTTIGQSVADETTSTAVKYASKYTTTHELLHGGEGWQVGDYFYVWMANARYKITIDAVSTSKVKANLGLVRPHPTPFDTKTTITAESILGDLRTRIIGDKVQFVLKIFNDNNDLKIRIKNHGLKTGTKVTYKTDGTAINGLTSGTEYYVIRNHAHNFYLATTAQNATNGTRITTTDTSLPTGPHTFSTTNVFLENNVQEIGNGIYITHTSDFNVSTPSSNLLNVVSGHVDTIADLPSQCKHGFVVKVANSQETEDDDYYLKFFGDNGKDGNGVWEECPKPGTEITFDQKTLPIQITSNSVNTFEVKFVSYEDATVGDTDPDTGTNPRPSFVGKTINNILFFRNRLCFLSDENIIMSRPGNFFNFWSKTATTSSVEDVIDVSCSSTTPAILYAGIAVNAGLVLFTDNRQFLLTTDSDVFSPTTVKFNTISTYDFNKATKPISLGTTIGFLNNANKFSRFLEMSNILREGEPTILEQSKVVSKLFSKDIELISNSKENSVIFFSEKGKNQLFGLRYYQSGDERILQSWFEWEISGEIQYHCMIKDVLFVVTKNANNNNKFHLLKYSIKLDDAGRFISQDDEEYRVHLDCLQRVTNTNTDSYNNQTNKTTFTVPINDLSGNTTNLAVYNDGNRLVSGGNKGLFSTDIEYVSTDGTNNTYTVTGQFVNDFNIGYLYNMEVELPKIFITQTAGERRIADTRGSLVLHRAKVSFGPVGLVSTTLKRKGKTDFTNIIEQPIADGYKANDAGIESSVIQTIPIYEKNTNVVLTIKSTHPGPATLYSYNWEGDYTNKLYRRV